MAWCGTGRACVMLAAAAATAVMVLQVSASARETSTRSQPASVSSQQALLDRYCLTCHNERLLAQGTVPVSFEALDTSSVGTHPEIWEQVVRKLRLGMMPPAGRPRPAGRPASRLAE